MSTLLIALTVVLAAAAGARSTWSPCGRSMLSTITPLGERGRGRSFGGTASWFIAGALAGGLTLGAVMALLAAAVGAVHLGAAATGVVVMGGALVTWASDARLGGWSLPFHRRQVNERWLDGYRSWVYGLGFGWQIGAGLATYVMTAAVYLLVVMGAITERPLVGLVAGTVFGLVRGLAVLLGRRLSTPVRLADFHRRFDGLDQMARTSMMAIEALIAVALAAMVLPWIGGVVASLVLAGWVLSPRVHRVVAPSGVAAHCEIRQTHSTGEESTEEKFGKTIQKRVTMGPQHR